MRITQLCLQCPDTRIPLDSFILSFDQDFWELKACDRMLGNSTYYQGAVQRLSQMNRSEFHSATQTALKQSTHDTLYKAINKSNLTIGTNVLGLMGPYITPIVSQVL